ncbi:MAG: hypothetical protein ABIH65_02685 [Nanoarchaeota archaeon]
MAIKKRKKEENKKTEIIPEIKKENTSKLGRVKEKKEDVQEEKGNVQLTKEESTKNQYKILKNFLIGMGSIIMLIFLIIFIINLGNNFEYQGMAVKVVKFCDSGPCLVTYNMQIPVLYKRENTTYNFYLRNDPRKLAENVKFEGRLVFRDIMVLNSTSDFNCNGKGIIAVANLLQLYKITRINVIKDENATCDPDGRYMFVKLQESNETSIEKVGPACYNINIKDCEILEGTERFMIETFQEINKQL